MSAVLSNTQAGPALHGMDLDIPDVAPHSAALILAGDGMDRMLKLAGVMASGRSTIPKHLQNNTGDCMAVIMQAMSWRMNPFAVAQKTHIVNGALGFEAQLINAAILSSGLLKARPMFEWYGDWSKVIGNFKDVESKKNPGETYRKLASTAADEKGCGCKISATLKGEDAPRVLDLLLTQAGVRNSPLWADDPRQQLAYLAIKRWARLYTPDVILGVYSPDELAEIHPGGERDMGTVDVVTTTDSDRAATVRDKLRGGGTGAAPAAPKGPTLDKVLKMISIATLDTLEHCIKDCTAIANADDKAVARKAYGDRMAVLKAEMEKPIVATKQEPTGATTGSAMSGGEALSYAHVADAINAAKNTDQLALAQDQIRYVVDAGQQEELRGLANARAADFSGGN